MRRSMFNVQHVTLCLLITYHWHGSNASLTGPGTATAGIATEVNGSPTDARLNIPVVKRSSNQTGFPNELRTDVRERMAAAVAATEQVATTLFEQPHEYANRKEEKYTAILDGTSLSALVESTSSVEGGKTVEALKNVEKEEAKEKGKVDPREIESSISAEDAEAREPGLIGIANSSPSTLDFQRRFDYKRASDTGIKRKRREATTSDVSAASIADGRNDSKKLTSSRNDENNSKANVSSTFASDSVDFSIGRAPNEMKEQDAQEDRNSLVLGTGNNVRELQKQRKSKDHEDYGGSRVSHRLSSLKLTEHPRTKLLGPVTPDYNSEITKVHDSRGLHQQSRNTKPENIIQQLRRHVNKQTLSLDHEVFAKTLGPRDINSNVETDIEGSAEDRSDRQFLHQMSTSAIPNKDSRAQLRFIPSNHFRTSSPDDTIYFSKSAKTFSPPGFSGSNNNNNERLSFLPPGELRPQGNHKLPRLDAAQIQGFKKTLRGVFDKYESRPGYRNPLPNVRMIQPKQIFIAPSRLIYDTKILPAPFAFPSFPQPSNFNDHSNRKKVEPGIRINGVFDHSEMQSDDREVIPVSEKSPPSLTNAENLFALFPSPYRMSEVSGGVNQATLDHGNTGNEIYGVSGTIGSIRPIHEYESERDAGNENSRLNHRTPFGLGGNGDHHHRGESSYDDSASTSGRQNGAGLGNVDHSPVIVQTIDEYGNLAPTIKSLKSPLSPIGIQTIVQSYDGTYDRSNHKWIGDSDNDGSRYAAKYAFNYQVSDHDTRNEFGHQETRDEGITRGKYHVRLPDGRIQEVNYHVDDEGYHALVSYQLDLTQ